MNDNTIILILVSLIALSILIIFVVSINESRKRQKKQIVYNSLDFKTEKIKNKLTYEDIRKAGDSLSSIVGLIIQ